MKKSKKLYILKVLDIHTNHRYFLEVIRQTETMYICHHHRFNKLTGKNTIKKNLVITDIAPWQELKGTCTVLNSKGDMYGNRYWSLFFTPDNNKSSCVYGSVSGDISNIESMLKYLANDSWDTKRKNFCIVHREDIPIRTYNRETKNFSYLGCCHDELAFNLLKKTQAITTT